VGVLLTQKKKIFKKQRGARSFGRNNEKTINEVLKERQGPASILEQPAKKKEGKKRVGRSRKTKPVKGRRTKQ